MKHTNEELAKGLVIGRELERIDWFNMSGPEALKWCQDHKTVEGLPEIQKRTIAVLAMQYVINGK